MHSAGARPPATRARPEARVLLLGQARLYPRPEGRRWSLLGKLFREMNDLKQVIADGATAVAIRKVSLHLYLLAQFEHAVNIV
jgi:hypothetical protein